jgi:hypothetical protein
VVLDVVQVKGVLFEHFPVLISVLFPLGRRQLVAAYFVVSNNKVHFSILDVCHLWGILLVQNG